MTDLTRKDMIEVGHVTVGWCERTEIVANHQRCSYDVIMGIVE